MILRWTGSAAPVSYTHLDVYKRQLYLRDGVLERTFNREQFCGLTEQEREELGLRTLTPAACTLPAVAPAGTKEGLSVEGLTCAYRKEPAVFQGLSFSARPGEVVSITGPNGCLLYTSFPGLPDSK